MYELQKQPLGSVTTYQGPAPSGALLWTYQNFRRERSDRFPRPPCFEAAD